MPLDANSRVRVNLSKTVILLFDPTALGLDILAQILAGFGARLVHRCRTADEARQLVAEHQIDLMIIDAVAQTGAGYELVRWLRQHAPEPNRHAPVLMTAAHTRGVDVKGARDCGSHFIVAKPLAPKVVLERILWIAKAGRPFMLSDSYIGPDRRWRADDEAPHQRRREDAARQANAAAEPALEAVA